MKLAQWKWICTVILSLMAIPAFAGSVGQSTIKGLTYDVRPQAEVTDPAATFRLGGEAYALKLVSPATQPVVNVSRPSIETTGPVPGTLLKASGSIKATAGQVIQNLFVKGSIDASAGNVTIRNCRIDGNGGRYGITSHGATKPVLVEDCEIYNVASACVYGENITLRTSYLHDSNGDGIKCNLNGRFERNLIEKLGRSPDAHADGIQIIGGDNIVLVNNYFNASDLNGYKINSPIFIQGDKATSRPSKNIKITGNWIRYGQFGVRPRSDYGQAATIEVKANVFYSGTFRSSFGSIETGVVWTLNLNDKGAVAKPGDK